MWTYRAHVNRVIDGDTIDVQLDLGLTVKVDVRLRLEGVWAVEHDHPRANEVTAALTSWLVDNGGDGYWPIVVRTIRVRDDSHEVTTFTRYVAQVTNPLGTSSLNAYMANWLAANGLTGGIGA